MKRMNRSGLRIFCILASGTVLAACDTVVGESEEAATQVNLNTPPVISGTPETVVEAGEFYQFMPNATDNDGDSITFAIENKPDWASFNNANGHLTGLPSVQHTGMTMGVTISATDGTDSVSLPAFDIEVSGPAGVAPNNAPTISGTPNRVARVGESYRFAPQARDADNDALTFSIINQPAWMNFNRGTGVLSGTPEAGDVGVYGSISIRVFDGAARSSLPAFEITVLDGNSPPRISGTPPGRVTVGEIYEFIPDASDPDDDPLVFSIDNRPSWAGFDDATGGLVGAPTADDAGDYTGIRISVTDGFVTRNLPRFDIQVAPAGGAAPANQPPTISGTPQTTVNAGDAYSFTPDAADPDDDTLVFSISNRPSWATFDNVTGTLSGNPGNADVGNYGNIRIRVTDGTDTVSLPFFTIVVQDSGGTPPANAAPQIGGNPPNDVDAGQLYSFTPSASDADDDTLVFSVSNRPSWATFDTDDGQLRGTPGDSDVGTYQNVSITVSDGVDTDALPAFDITVHASAAPPPAANQAPTISGQPDTSVTEGALYRFTPSASDPENDPLVFSITNRPGWATFDRDSGELSGTPSGADVGDYTNIRISVSDGQANAQLDPFTIAVNASSGGNPPPSNGAPDTYYAAPLSTSCNPSNPGSGTISDPWTNPYYALTRGGLQPGDTLQLRGGTYQNSYDGWMNDSSPENRWNACDDDERSSNGDGTHTVLPLFLSGTASQNIIIENYPGETVIIDGTNARMNNANWSSCGSGTFQTDDFNVGSARTPQIWVDPASANDPGTRLEWNSSGSCSLSPGQFTVGNGGRTIYVRLADGSNPSNHEIKMSCQGGDCAAHPVHAEGSASHITVRRNPDGGRFVVKYGYYIGYIAGGAHHLDFDGLNWIAGGGRDYGYCFRVHDGREISIKNGICRETMGEGIGLYGGGPQDGIQISDIVVDNMEVYDTGRGWVDGGGNGNSLGMGVILKNCRDCVVRNSKIHGSYRAGIQVNHSSNGCPSAACDASNVLIENNEIWDFCRLRSGSNPNAGKSDCGAILLRANGTNGFINGGTIRNNSVYGLFPTPFTNSASPSGIYTDGDIPNVVIENNSLFEIPGACINVYPNPNSVSITGNAMSMCSANGGGCNGQSCALYTDGGASHDTRYNTYWSASGSDQVVRQNRGSGYTRDSVTGFEATAVQANPDFMSNTNLRLRSQSQLIDALPCNEAPAKDADGKSRPQGGACDVGAFEQ